MSRTGSRSGKYGAKGEKNSPQGFLSMLYTGVAKITLHEKPGRDDEAGPDIILSIVQMGRMGRIELNLSDQSEEELHALRDIISEALEWAIPVARRRDKEARDEFDKGNDVFERVYRAAPSVVYRKRPERSHSEGLFGGSEIVPRSQSGDDGDSDGGSGDTGSDLVEPDQSVSISKDYRTPPSLT